MRSDEVDTLNDPAALSAADPGDMLGKVMAFPDDLAAGLACSFAPAPAPGPTRILAAGMGGSAIAGELLAALLVERGGLPMICIRGYDLPATRPGDFLIVSSYSGETEESLSVLEDGLSRGMPIAVMASGGKAASLAAEHNLPFCSLPAGLPPRAALGAMLGRLLALLAHWGQPVIAGEEMAETISELRELVHRCQPAIPLKDNIAKTLALAASGTRLVAVSMLAVAVPIATRLRCQMEENAGIHVLQRDLPEMHHNSWVPWADDDPLGRPVWIGAFAAHPRVRLRRKLSDDLLAASGKEGLELPSRGSFLPTRMLTSLLLADFISVYCALMRLKDPTPVAPLTAMKGELAASQEGI